MIYSTSKWKKYQIENLENAFIRQSGKKWRNFLYFSTYLTSFPQSGRHFTVAIHFQEEQNRLSNFIYFFMHISFHVHKVDYISPVRFISTKWKIFHQRTVFPRSRWMFNVLHYWQIVKTDRDRSWNMFISTKLKTKLFYLFLYIFVFICTRWEIFTNTYIHQKVFNDLH